MVKDAPNHVPMNMVVLAQTSRKILKDGDVPILSVLPSTPDFLQFSLTNNGIVLVSRYPPYVWMLIHSVYDRKFSAIVRHSPPMLRGI